MEDDSSHKLIPRRYYFVPVLAVVWIVWFALMQLGNHWHLLMENWLMAATMCIGSFVAGATSEGGGAVAFPVMTLIFNIEPYIARDFSLMIQSVGMSMAATLIFCLQIRIEPQALLFAALGGAIGIIIGMEFISPWLPPAFTKIFFTSLWLSFAIALYEANRQRDRIVLKKISSWSHKKRLLTVAIGIVGGMISGVLGSGLDIITFTLLTLYFRIDEKVATPTSVVLMASNALVGVFWKSISRIPLAPEAWNYWWACIPVVVLGAPLGALFIRNQTRQFIVLFLYSVIIIQYLGALIVVPQSPVLLLFSFATVIIGLLLFRLLNSVGIAHFNQAQSLYSKE